MKKIIVFVCAILLISLARAADTTTAASTTPAVTIPSTPYYYQNPTGAPQASWQTGYCNNTGMDFLVVLDPTACSPAPVRSDLLADQEVPVMCRLTGIKINPLIQVPYIKSVVVGIENKSKEVSYASFYPARSALTQSYLLSQPSSGFEGSPTMNNLGYLWIQLARQPVESQLPEKITVNANAIITYDIGRTYGINENQFVLPLLSQEEWLKDYKYYNFWKGKGYVRLMNITGKNNAKIGIYSNIHGIPQTEELRAGGPPSKQMLLPGFYCGAGVQVRLDNVSTPQNRARLIVNGNEELVASGEYISDSECQVGNITTTPGYGGTVPIRCRNAPFKNLTIKDFGATLEITDFTEDAGKPLPREQSVVIGNQILLKNQGQAKNYSLYTGFVGKQLDLKTGITGIVVTFNKPDGSPIKNKADVDKIVSIIYDYMKAQRGDSLTVPESDLNTELKAYLELRGVKEAAKKYDFDVWKENEEGSATFDTVNYQIKPVEVEGPQQVTYKDPAIEAAYKGAIDKYKAMAHEYSTKPSPEGMWYGVIALKQASDLASEFQKMADKAEILKELIDKYSQADEPEIVQQVEWAREELRRTIAGGSGNRYATVSTSSGSYSIELVGIEKSGAMEYSVLEIERGSEAATTGQYSKDDEIDGWKIMEITDDSIRLRNVTNATAEQTISKGGSGRIDNTRVKVIDIVRKLEAKVTVLPLNTNRTTEANFTVQIGIEKSAFKLSPEQTKDLISKLDDTIEKLTGINKNLGNVVSWWKKACYAGAGALWIKNFVTGLSGEATARKIVMETWGEKCADTAFRKQIEKTKNVQPGLGNEVIPVDQCFRLMENDINKDVSEMKTALDKSNEFINQVKAGAMCKGKEAKSDEQCKVEDEKACKADSSCNWATVTRSCGLFNMWKCVDDVNFIEESQNVLLSCASAKNKTECDKKAYCSWDVTCLGTAIKEYVYDKEGNLIPTGKYVDSSLIAAKMKKLNDKGWLFKDDVKDIYLNLALYKQCVEGGKFSASFCDSVKKSTYKELSAYQDYIQREKLEEETAKFASKTLGINKVYSVQTGLPTPFAEKIFSINKTLNPNLEKGFSPDIVNILQSKLDTHKNYRGALLIAGDVTWLMLVEPKSGEEEYYSVKEHIPLEQKGDLYYEKAIADVSTATKDAADKVVEIKEINLGACGGNTITRGPESGEPRNTIKFWERYAHQGVAYMPLGDGWYFATTPQSWKENGDLEEAIVCNVGPDGIPNFDFSTGTGLGDDAQCCTRFKIGVGVPATVQVQYEKIKQCAPQAMKNFKAGEREIKISGCLGTYKLGKAPVATPTARCEDFMKPSDCKLMYNLCDPVLCPSSRCNFGGNIPVENVKQSGVIGSIMLCLPNFEGGSGVLVPVCLDGVHAGIENWISVLNDTRKCLNEQLTTGQKFGICKQIESFYMCDLFWKELDPLLKTGIPAMTESLTSKGGGEYVFFSDSWKQSVSAMQYFTDSYAVETFSAFKARSTKEVETEVCKKFVGVSYPGQAKFWDELSKPESPYQTFAKFQEIPLGGPSPNSQYDVYFHIYAGKDQGVYYRVWLKRAQSAGLNPPPTEYMVPEAFGYLQAGESADKTKDFPAPSGYTQVCISINEKETCGFLQAGTDFALTELQDYYLKNQVEQGITTAKDCSDGKATIFPTPEITTNIQSAVEYALDPQIYRRGIIRTCSGPNPGGGVESGSWKRVGYCDNKVMGCWIYLPSINDSITDLGIVKELYNYSENKDIADAVTRLGLDPRNTSQEYLDLYEPSIDKLAEDANNMITESREKFKNNETNKTDYYKEIGYSLKEGTDEWLASLFGRDAKFIETLTRVRDKCAHPDEKARADWQIGRLLELKARLLSLPDVFEAEKINKCLGLWLSPDECTKRGWDNKGSSDFSDASNNQDKICCVERKVEVIFWELFEGQECKKANGEIVEKSTCSDEDVLAKFPILEENFKNKIDRFNHPYFGDYISEYYPGRYESIHRGIDIYVIGDGAPVLAIASGEVIDASGNCMSIYHPNIDYTSVYCHVNNIQVKKGEEVEAGKEIAKVYYPAAPHLHLTIYKGKISTIPSFASTFAECGCNSDEECDASPKLGCQLLDSDKSLINPIYLVGDSPSYLCCKAGKKEKLNCASFKAGVDACNDGHFGQCWWDAMGPSGSQCKDCPQLHDGDCEGAKSWALDLFEKNILFKTQDDCEDNNCGLDCLWIGKPARTEEKKCYNIDMVSLKNKAEEINAAQIEKGKEQKRIDELNKLILLTNKHKDELDKIYNEKGEVTYDADMLLSDLTLKVAALEESIRGAAQQAALGRQLTQDELDEAEAAYRNYVPGAVEKIMGSGAEYDCADFAIAVLEDFAKNYKNEELKLALYNSAGAVTSNYGPQISAEHLALYNTKEVSGKADVGDMLIYDWGTGKWHAIVIYRRQDIVSGQTCIYRLAMGNLEEGTPTKIAFVDGTGIASEDQYAGEDYNRYVKWLTSGGDKGKFLYKNAPRQWDFAKILRVQEAA